MTSEKFFRARVTANLDGGEKKPPSLRALDELRALRTLLAEIRALAHEGHPGEVDVCFEPICRKISDGLELT